MVVHQVFLVLAATRLSAEVVNKWYGHRGEVILVPQCQSKAEALLDEKLSVPDPDRVLIFHLDASDSIRNWSWFLGLLKARNYAPTIFRV